MAEEMLEQVVSPFPVSAKTVPFSTLREKQRENGETIEQSLSTSSVHKHPLENNDKMFLFPHMVPPCTDVSTGM